LEVRQFYIEKNVIKCGTAVRPDEGDAVEVDDAVMRDSG
jgi:hypothetical protein